MEDKSVCGCAAILKKSAEDAEEHGFAFQMLDHLGKANRRMFALCVALLIALLATNIARLVYEAQYQNVETTTPTQDANAGSGSVTQYGIGSPNGDSNS
jgi:hypothetical protein